MKRIHTLSALFSLCISSLYSMRHEDSFIKTEWKEDASGRKVLIITVTNPGTADPYATSKDTAEFTDRYTAHWLLRIIPVITFLGAKAKPMDEAKKLLENMTAGYSSEISNLKHHLPPEYHPALLSLCQKYSAEGSEHGDFFKSWVDALSEKKTEPTDECKDMRVP